MLPTDRPRNPFRRLLIYFGVAEDPSNPGSEPERSTPPKREHAPPSEKARLAALEAAR